MLVVLLTVGLLGVVTAPAAAATTDTVEVVVAPDGDATVSVVHRFDLTTETESDAFARLAEDSVARTAFQERFQDRLERVARTTADATDRSMTVRNANVDVRTEGSVGVVELSAEWEGLAAVDGDRVVVTEPFASGFVADATLRLSAPDRATVDAVAPTPSDRDGARLAWSPGTALDGFSVAYDVGDVTASDGSGATSASGPGFDVALALLALAGAGVLAWRR